MEPHGVQDETEEVTEDFNEANMKNILFDIETNGLLDELDRVHSLVMLDMGSGEMVSCADQDDYTPIEVGLKCRMRSF